MNVHHPLFKGMPADSAFRPMLQKLYAILTDAAGAPACAILSTLYGEAKAVEMVNGEIVVRTFDNARDAYQHCGYGSCTAHVWLDDYDEVVSVLEDGGFTPERIMPLLWH